MSSNVDVSKLAEAFSESYNVDELEIFLADYFNVRLGNIVQPHEFSMQRVVGEVIDYFDRRGNLFDLIREFGRDRPGKVDIRDLLLPPTAKSLLSENSIANALRLSSDIFQDKIATNDFDVFLCYHGIDNTFVKHIGEQLKVRGLLPWLDEWELRPGLPWQRLLEDQIENIKTVAVFVGPNGIGPWQHIEIDAFLREFIRRHCPVIPVILPNVEKEPRLPPFLASMTWVDFRKQSPDPMERLIWGITGKRGSISGPRYPIAQKVDILLMAATELETQTLLNCFSSAKKRVNEPVIGPWGSTIPVLSDEWKQEFLDCARSRKLSKSYKPVMIKAFFKLVDREGKVRIDDLVREFRDYYIQRVNAGQPLERSSSIMVRPTEASYQAVKSLIVTNPLERFLIKNFIQYFPEEGILQIAPQLWQDLYYYEMVDTLKSVNEQIRYYEV